MNQYNPFVAEFQVTNARPIMLRYFYMWTEVFMSFQEFY